MTVTRSRVTCLVRLTQLRYLSFPAAAFALGYVGASGRVDAYLMLGIAAFVTWEGVLHFYNHVADREGDEIDYPERTAMCKIVGYERLREGAFVLAGVYLSLVAMMVWMSRISIGLTLIWLALLIGAFGYSMGPRVKARTFGSVAILALLVITALTLGWWYRGGIVELVPIATVIGLARVSCSWSKDLPNLEGDSATGFYSVSWYLIGSAKVGRRAERLLLVPYVLIGLFVLFGIRPLSDLMVLTLIPAGLVLARVMRAAESLEERAFAPELANLYLITLVGLVGVSLDPSPPAAVVLVASLAWYVIATRYLHTEPDLLTRRSLRLLRVLATRRPSPGASRWSHLGLSRAGR